MFDSFSPYIIEKENKELIKEITEEEIRAALPQINSVKAFGPNGLQAGFNKKIWKIIGKSVCRMVKVSFIMSHAQRDK